MPGELDRRPRSQRVPLLVLQVRDRQDLGILGGVAQEVGAHDQVAKVPGKAHELGTRRGDMAAKQQHQVLPKRLLELLDHV